MQGRLQVRRPPPPIFVEAEPQAMPALFSDTEQNMTITMPPPAPRKQAASSGNRSARRRSRNEDEAEYNHYDDNSSFDNRDEPKPKRKRTKPHASAGTGSIDHAQVDMAREWVLANFERGGKKKAPMRDILSGVNIHLADKCGSGFTPWKQTCASWNALCRIEGLDSDTRWYPKTANAAHDQSTAPRRRRHRGDAREGRVPRVRHDRVVEIEEAVIHQVTVISPPSSPFHMAASAGTILPPYPTTANHGPAPPFMPLPMLPLSPILIPPLPELPRLLPELPRLPPPVLPPERPAVQEPRWMPAMESLFDTTFVEPYLPLEAVGAFLPAAASAPTMAPFAEAHDRDADVLFEYDGFM